MLIKQN